MTATDSLTTAQRFATQCGWAPIPLMPLGKAAALAGYYQTASQDPKAIRAQWKRAQFRIDHDTIHPGCAGLEPGIGVVLGRSGLAVLDADTPDQVAAVHAAFSAWGMELGEPTVRTPGTIDANGVRLHSDGGHWYFKLPEDIVAAFSGLLVETKLVIKVGPEGSPKGDLMTGKCYVATPPTRRTEGEYLKTPGARLQALPAPLAVQLRVELTRIEKQRREALERAATAERDEEMWAWFDRTPWEAVLPDDYREVGVEPSGCVRYLREGGSSSHSATVHVAGCPHIIGGDPSSPPLVTFFTSERPEYVVRALTRKDGTPKQSAGKFALFTYKFHNGNWRAARQAAGLSVRSRRPVPRTPRAAASGGWTTHPATSATPPTVTPPGPKASPPTTRESDDGWTIHKLPPMTPAPKPPKPKDETEIDHQPVERRWVPADSTICQIGTEGVPIHCWFDGHSVHVQWDGTEDVWIASSLHDLVPVTPEPPFTEHWLAPPTRSAGPALLALQVEECWTGTGTTERTHAHLIWHRSEHDAALLAQLAAADIPELLDPGPTWWSRCDTQAEEWRSAIGEDRMAEAREQRWLRRLDYHEARYGKRRRYPRRGEKWTERPEWTAGVWRRVPTDDNPTSDTWTKA